MKFSLVTNRIAVQELERYIFNIWKVIIHILCQLKYFLYPLSPFKVALIGQSTAT